LHGHPLSSESCRVAEAGLIQQWYTDQPAQRIYAVVVSCNWSSYGLSLLKDKERVRRAIMAVIARHNALTTTIHRDTKTTRAYIVTRDPINTEDLGPLPLTWLERKNFGTWRDCYHTLTHTTIDESKWLFRFGLVLSDSGGPAEIILSTHHVITDGMSSLAIIKDFLAFLCTDDSTILPSLPYIVMDEVIDLRPPLSHVLKVLGEDMLPNSLRAASLNFYQGPNPSPANIPLIEGHLATIHIPPTIFRKLAAIAKSKRISINGLLGGLALVAEAKTIQEFQKRNNNTSSNSTAPSSIRLKYAYPNGKSCREIGHLSSEQVGCFVSAQDLLFEIPSNSLTTPPSSSSSPVWEIARSISDSAKVGPREALDSLSLVNFLPRDSITPWILKDSRRYVFNRNKSLEMSNLGNVDLIDHNYSKSIQDDVQKMFMNPNDMTNNPQQPFKEVILCQGQVFMSSVFMLGVATIHEQLTISITCQWGQCGCQESISESQKKFYEDHVDSLLGDKDEKEKNHNGFMVCACPKDQLLHRFTSIAHQELLNFVSCAGSK
jgi:hypothetical protein